MTDGSEEDEYTILELDPDAPNTRLRDPEAVLRRVREAIAALQATPAMALDSTKYEQLQDAVEDLRSLERSLANETDQLQEDNDD